MDYSKFISKRSEKRKANLIRQITAIYLKNPELIPLAGGLPNAETFPFEEINVTYKDGTRHEFTGRDLNVALQYGPSEGYPPLIDLWRKFQTRCHSPPRNDWDLIVSTGSQDACSKVLELFLSEGDAALIQVPVYSGTLGALDPLGVEFIGIEQDADGINPEKIKEACEAREKAGLAQPKLLFVNPTGSNPTGSVLSEDRRREVYALAQKYDFLIIEDDAYYFVHFLDYKPTSFLSLDTDGRVIRVDSFSKIISAGIRIGILTAHKDIVKHLTTHTSSSTLHTSSLSQVLIYKLLDSWGPEKFEDHLKNVRKFYKIKRDVMIASADKYLTGLAEWSVPKGGMFLWIKVKGIDNVFDLVMDEFISNGILVLPGHAFNQDIKTPDQHLRLSYSYVTPEQSDKGLSTIAELLKKYGNK